MSNTTPKVYERGTLAAIMRNAEREDMLSDEVQEEAYRFLRAKYYTSVRYIAEMLAHECIDPETRVPRDDDKLKDMLHEVVDGSQWVIYTHKAHLVAAVTDNVDAIEDFIDGDTDEKRIKPEQVAYWAMRQDVQDLLSNEYFLKDMFAKE